VVFFLKKSARVALTFLNLERTLEPVEITAAVTSVTATLKKFLGRVISENRSFPIQQIYAVSTANNLPCCVRD